MSVHQWLKTMTLPDNCIRQIDPLDDPQWDANIAQCPGASFFHGAAWARVLRDTYRFRPLYLVETASRLITGVLPVMEVDSWLTGRRGISLPFTDECEPLGADLETRRRLVRAVSSLAVTRKWRHWELRGGTSLLGAPASVAFHGHRLELCKRPEALFLRCDSAVRRALRKAEKSNLRITFSQSVESIRAFHALLCTTRQRQGMPPQPLRFFENIQRHVLAQQHGCVVLAYNGDMPVAGAVFFHFARSALFKFGASDDAFQHLRPNNLVMWRAIEWHARSGFESLDFGRTSLGNQGLRQFKLGWGTEERRIEYARFDRKASAFVIVKDNSSGWHSRMFRLVPATLARFVGAATYKHVA